MIPFHFTWEFSAGQIFLSFPLISLSVYLFKMYKVLAMFRVEHEILMQAWADAQKPPQVLSNLPWRNKKW